MSNPQYTVYLRFPFPRNGFEEPAPAEWNSSKETALWDILSKTHKRSDINWNQLANKFQVSVPYLLQQTAWLYERELQQVHEEMNRVAKQVSASKSSVTTLRKDCPMPTTSSSTVDRSFTNRPSSALGRPESSQWHPFSRDEHALQEGRRERSSTISSIGSRSQTDDDKSEAVNDSFIPLFSADESVASERNDGNQNVATQASYNRQQRAHPSFLNRTNTNNAPSQQSHSSLAGIQNLNSRPDSNGSSFSDLSEASISRSALEEALLNDLRNGGSMASRMSNISAVLRSKYFDR
ncbi:hypothetical protein V1514DRAFT_334387 [Lipomyces japonicus]|uniref:uncharacterized protein n=1 Tax=Lipomyces japonicus TaxID=56871 RepID=UPI0034CE5AAB